MPKVTFSKEEYDHIADSFDRIRQSLSKIRPADWNKGNNPIIKQITIKFSRLATSFEQYEVFLKRQHLRLLQEYCDATIKRLNEVIIPEYEKRGNKPEYIVDAKALILKVEGIKQKVEVTL